MKDIGYADERLLRQNTVARIIEALDYFLRKRKDES
jgi:hypothetical protein